MATKEDPCMWPDSAWDRVRALEAEVRRLRSENAELVVDARNKDKIIIALCDTVGKIERATD